MAGWAVIGIAVAGTVAFFLVGVTWSEFGTLDDYLNLAKIP